MKIALVPRGTGSGHNMRLYAIGKAIKDKNASINEYAFLESLKGTFSKMFESIGASVIDMSQGRQLDYSKGFILTSKLNWNSLINGFLGPTIFNSAKILFLINLFNEQKIDLVISDLDISAIVAANFCGIKSILVSERYELPISKFTNDDLKNAGFEIDSKEVTEVHKVIKNVFDWGLDNATRVVTDCPYVDKLDKKLHFKDLLDDGHAIFVGPIN